MQIIFFLLLTVLYSPKVVQCVTINSSSTLNPLHFAETAANEYYPFMYEVPPVIQFIMENETLRKNFSYGNPYHNLKRHVIGDTAYWKIQYCGIHFLSRGDGYILGPHLFDHTDPRVRCIWSFVGDHHCTPQMECTRFKDKGGECRENYLQVTDGGDSFVHHFCDNNTAPEIGKLYRAHAGILDVVYRYTSFKRKPDFECHVKCVNYPVNFTATGSNLLPDSEKLKVVVNNKPPPFEDTLPVAQTYKDCQCGMSNEGAAANRTRRIVGGRETLVSQYPWTLGIKSKYGKLPYCGGSLVSDRFVLTAMHCVEDEDTEDIIVILNEHDFFNDTETTGPTIRRGVEEVIPYNYYLDSTFYGDAALLKLDRPVEIQAPMFTPICLPSSEMELYQGREVIAAGWGTTKGGFGALKSPKLLEVPLVVYSNDACNDYHSHTPPEPPQVTDNMLCAGYSEGGRDTCAGDSGGPLIAKMKNSGRYEQIGITSWGYGCAIRLNPGVFSRVTSFNYWIRMHTVDGRFCS
ncbi:unnamed protein product [Orchesella dallaii]|uniref:Uncharacterized protein n=1 Tax=Orchesella dallaii TaxID=48710 RepID=A0ABP1PQ64_9HEXA